MPNSEWIESILEDESLTDGLTDDEAKLLIDWGVTQAEIATDSDQVDRVRAQMRGFSKAAQALSDEASEGKVRFYLAKALPSDTIERIYPQLTHKHQFTRFFYPF